MLEIDERRIIVKRGTSPRAEKRLYLSSFTPGAARLLVVHLCLLTTLFFAGSLMRARDETAGYWFYFAGLLYIFVTFFLLHEELGKRVEVRQEKVVLYSGLRRHEVDWSSIRRFEPCIGRLPWGRGALIEGQSRSGAPVRFTFFKATFHDFHQLASLIKVGKNDSWRNYLKKMNLAGPCEKMERLNRAISLD